MDDLKYIKLRWSSIIDELTLEKYDLEYYFKEDKYSHSVSREAIQTMTQDEIDYFYDSAINHSKVFASIELFVWFEKFLFDDLRQRVNDANDIMHKMFNGFSEESKVAKILGKWKPAIAQEELFSKLFIILNYRHWVLHGQRWIWKGEEIYDVEEIYSAVCTAKELIEAYR